MKQAKNLLIVFLLVATVGAKAQVGIGTTTPDSSAQLDVRSTTKGLLPPRMTGAERNAIVNPAAGLMIFCTDCNNGVIQVYNGTHWTSPTGSAATTNNLEVGQFFRGGIIAYIYQPGDLGYDPSVPHGLIAGVSDLIISTGMGIPWWNGVYVSTNATGTAIGTGSSNTSTIVSAQGGPSEYAAYVCSNYTNAGFSDWYLPSKDELNKLFINHKLIGGFSINYYWSSTESSSTNAWRQYFGSGTQNTANKSSNTIYVRPVRYF